MKFKTITENGYTFDRRIFWGVIGLCLLVILLIGYKENFNFKYHFYFECKKEMCPNPMLDYKINNQVTNYDYKQQCTEAWCTAPFITRGVYGKKPIAILKFYPYIVWGLVLLGLSGNHFIHNRGKKFGLTLNVPDKWKRKAKELSDKYIKED